LQFGLSEFDVGVGIFGADDGKYRMDEEWSMESLKTFVADFEAGKVDKVRNTCLCAVVIVNTCWQQLLSD
jgi:hypothetical protein